MYCPKCGNNIADESTQYCPVCGYDLSILQQQSKNILSVNNAKQSAEYSQMSNNEYTNEMYKLTKKKARVIMGVILGTDILVIASLIVFSILFASLKKEYKEIKYAQEKVTDDYSKIDFSDNSDADLQDKEKKSQDISSAKTIKTAVETAMASERTYEILTTSYSHEYGYDDLAGSVVITPGAHGASGVAVITQSTNCTYEELDAIGDDIAQNIGEYMPEIMYKEAADGIHMPVVWVVTISVNGSVRVGLSDAESHDKIIYELAPEIDISYN